MAKNVPLAWTPEARERLRVAARAYGTLDKLQNDSGIPKPTLQKMLSGDGDPGISRVAKLATTIGLSLDSVLTGRPDAPAKQFADMLHGALPDVLSGGQGYAADGQVKVPIVDVMVSAGAGRTVTSEASHTHATFPRDWLRGLGNPDRMEIVRIDGDSMEPELRHGDMAMVDLDAAMRRDGLAVVRLGDDIVIKRLRLRGGGKAELVSTNPAYPPLDLDLGADDIAVVGRVVWTGKVY